MEASCAASSAADAALAWATAARDTDARSFSTSASLARLAASSAIASADAPRRTNRGTPPAPPAGPEPPSSVPAGSNMSPSKVTHGARTPGANATAFAAAASIATKKPPNAYSIAGASASAYEMQSIAGQTRGAALEPPAARCASAICAADKRPRLTWLSGTRVTRFLRRPRSRSALPVSSVSTTMWCRRPPAPTSSAPAASGRVTRNSVARTPRTDAGLQLGPMAAAL
jgi:hypothetical protein